MNHPHFRTSAAAAAFFDARVATTPDVAVRVTLTRGFSIAREDLATSHTDALASMPRDMKGDYQLRHAAELSRERIAITLIANQETIFRTNEAAAAKADAQAREDRIVARVAELHAEHVAELQARFRARAEAEVDGVQIVDAPQPEQPRAARTRRTA